MTWLKSLFKLKLVIIFFICAYSSLIFSQSPTDRITEIKGMYNEIMGLGETLKHELGLEISSLDAQGSKFFKTVYQNTPRIIRRK
jgi:hypothetical protein